MQLPFEFPVTFGEQAYAYGERTDGETHGVVLTKPHVVNLILDLAGYREGEDLLTKRLLEPSCGLGAFLVPAIERLARSAKYGGVQLSNLTEAIVAFDIDAEHVRITRAKAVGALMGSGVGAKDARVLAERWIRRGDFLLAQLDDDFDVVVGNPPYVRIEQLAPEIQAEYRRRYQTLYDRADLYVAFIERSLSLLGAGGVLSFVCADRWTLNRYGAPLRRFIAERFAVRAYVDLHQTSPFESEVIAYPSVFVIARERRGIPVKTCSLASATPEECRSVSDWYLAKDGNHNGLACASYETWFSGDEPWVLTSPEHLAVLRDLERRFPLLEQSGHTRVRIGIATGADQAYIVPADADIEPSRLVPLVMRDDIEQGKVVDRGRRVINTYETEGIIDLPSYPRLKGYLESHSGLIRRRHIAKGSPIGWFRTIDRPYPELVGKPKLLIPDIAGANEVVFEEGRFYPHHNLYFVVSEEWDLEVLGGLLSSRVALFFVWSYAVKMRGGYLRFQAQYLRRIRVPAPDQIAPSLGAKIRAAFRKRDFVALDALAKTAYNLAELPDFDFVDTRR